jgi:uncharacterized membrane protein
MFTTHSPTMWLLLAAAITAGLAAGLLYAFAVAVMPGLAGVQDAAFVSVMQSINRRIINPWFLLTFLGAPLLAMATVISRYLTGGPGPWWPLLTAAALALLSVLITAALNIPLNTALDAAGSIDPASVREAFESRWVSWNIARAIVSTLAFGFLVLALALGN